MDGPEMDGKVALITGAGSGLGAAIARRLAADGVYVVANDLNGDTAAAIAEELKGEPAVFDADAVAEFVRFLAGPESSYCFGEILTLTGGY
jgi:NAD(P)-dependent dehydrogenase (short-subunit alcohol dehydrogenase family)